MDWASGYIEAGGFRLETRVAGPAPGDGPVLVLLHEGLGSAGLWRDFPEALAGATGRPVFAWSRAGYGQSDAKPLPWPLDYMTREALEVLPGVLDALGARDVILCGHSDGATIAAIHSGKLHDPRVRGVIMMAPHFFTEPEGLAAIAEAKRAYDEGGLREKMARHHRDPDNAFHGWNDSWLHPDFETWNVADALDGIAVPVLVVQGEGDQYGTLAQLREVEARVPGPVTTAVLSDCAHAPHLEARAATLAAIGAFVARLELGVPLRAGEG